MRRFSWSSAYSIYVPEIDAEHRALFCLASRLQRDVSAGCAPEQLRPAVEELVSHAVRHFSHEERLMRSDAYPLYEWHKRQHKTARDKAMAMERRLMRGDQDAVPLLLDFLSTWLGPHIRLADRMLGAYLRNCERTRAALVS
jgi:hemerythrin